MTTTPYEIQQVYSFLEKKLSLQNGIGVSGVAMKQEADGWYAVLRTQMSSDTFYKHYLYAETVAQMHELIRIYKRKEK